MEINLENPDLFNPIEALLPRKTKKNKQNKQDRQKENSSKKKKELERRMGNKFWLY